MIVPVKSRFGIQTNGILSGGVRWGGWGWQSQGTEWAAPQPGVTRLDTCVRMCGGWPAKVSLLSPPIAHGARRSCCASGSARSQERIALSPAQQQEPVVSEQPQVACGDVFAAGAHVVAGTCSR